MTTAGKALAYTGHQRLTIRPPLLRLHHEVETFRCRAVSDTRTTVLEMEKSRTEYRAALSWMKSTSAQLDPDTGHGLDHFRKAQSYVRSSKTRFDQLMLACLQKVDLLAAARCNMFSHALVSYQSAIKTFSIKASEILSNAAVKLTNVQPYDFCVVSELTVGDKQTKTSKDKDKDQETFFNADYTDNPENNTKKRDSKKVHSDNSKNEHNDNKEYYNVKNEHFNTTNECSSVKKENSSSKELPNSKLEDLASKNLKSNNLNIVSNLLGEDFLEPSLQSENSQEESKPSSELFNLQWPTNSDFLGGDYMPSRFIQEGTVDFTTTNVIEDTNLKENKKAVNKENKLQKTRNDKTSSQMSWLSLFAELDPLASQEESELYPVGDRA